MAKDFADSYPVAHELIQQADDILGFSLSALMFEGPDELLNDTINTQPALYVSGLAILRALQAELPGYKEDTQQTRYRLLPGVW